MSTFKARLHEFIVKQGHHLCVGIDPDLEKNLHPTLARAFSDLGARDFLYRLSCHVIDAASSSIKIVKFQTAFFEKYGEAGFAALKTSIQYAHQKSMFVILDAKRGDIDSTMRAYGAMAFDYFGSDALTVLPYMGLDSVASLQPWLSQGKGAYVVWVSSNADGELIQKPIMMPLVRALNERFEKIKLRDSLGLVLGATKVAALDLEAFAAAQNFPLLLPGFGAQGAVHDTRSTQLLAKKSAALFPISRGIVDLSLQNCAADVTVADAWSFLSKSVHAQILHHIEQFS